MLKELFSPENPHLPDAERRIAEKGLVACSKDIEKAISEMLGLKVGVSHVSLNVVSFSDIPKQLNVYDDSVVMLHSRIVGVAGQVIVYAPLKDMVRIAEIFLHKAQGYFREISDENISVIREFSTIISDYYITALNLLFDSKYAISKPSMSTGLHKIDDKIKESLDAGSRDIEKTGFMTFQTDFLIDENSMNLKTLLLLSAKEVDDLFRAAKVDV